MRISIDPQIKREIIQNNVKDAWAEEKRKWEKKHRGNLEESARKSKLDKLFGKPLTKKALVIKVRSKLDETIYPKKEIEEVVSEFVEKRFQEIYG